jgi:hypothetical protein
MQTGDLPDASFGEEGAGTGLTIAFDTNDNGGGEAPAVDVKWRGQTIGHVPKNVNYNDGFVPVGITLNAGGALDVSWNNEQLYSGFLTGYTPIAGRFGFGARTGALNEYHFMDDLCISVESFANTPPTITPIPPQTITGANTGTDSIYGWRS